MPINDLPATPKHLFLLMPGFEEGTAVFCLERIREAGLETFVVGLSSTPVRGMHGIAIQPDLTLDDIRRSDGCPLLFISGGRQYLTSLLIDPRFYTLCQQVIRTNGIFASSANSSSFLQGAGVFEGGRHITQEDRFVEEFAAHLIALVQRQSNPDAHRDLNERPQTV